jgi:hypothetical protein
MHPIWLLERGAPATYANGSPDVLGEDDALELNDEEVEELLNIVEEALERLLGDDKILAGTHASGQAISENRMAGNLSCGSDYASVSLNSGSHALFSSTYFPRGRTSP